MHRCITINTIIIAGWSRVATDMRTCKPFMFSNVTDGMRCIENYCWLYIDTSDLGFEGKFDRRAALPKLIESEVLRYS